ncbi:MAG TPA: hypothetical protein VEU47_14525 [Candidatus Cybelea sp.]|nr:hypothetical protein [Candidatus Cybelea sp.]
MSEARLTALEDRGTIAVRGADARDFLQGLISNDVAKTGPNRAIYAALLTPQGKFLHDFFVVALGDALLLDCEGPRAGDLLRRLRMYKLRAKIDLADASTEYRIGVAWGDDALSRLGVPAEAGRAVAIDGGVAYADPRLLALGGRFILPRDRFDSAVARFGFARGTTAEYDALRLSLGVPDGSRDVPVDKAFLLESNFEELNGVDFKKGCYVGQELTARTKHRGVVRKRLFRVDIDGPLPAPGTPIMRGDKEAGTIRSGVGRTAIALIRLEDYQAALESGQKLTADGVNVTPIKPSWVNF